LTRPARKFIAPRRQGAKKISSYFSELGVSFGFAQDMLCGFARVVFFDSVIQKQPKFKFIG
jgi:hypothetical protein